MNKKYLLLALLVLIIGGAGAYYSSGKNLTGDFSSASESSSSTGSTSTGSTSTESTSTSTTSSTYSSGGTTTEATTNTTSAYKLYLSSASTKGVTYTAGQNDFQVLYFGLRNNETDDVQVTSLAVELTATGEGLLNESSSPITANYSDMKIVDKTGATIMTTSGISESGSDTVQTLTFTGTINLSGATITQLYLKADAANIAALAADTITPKIYTSSIVATLTSTGAAITTADIPTTALYGKRNTCR